jgi:hypothetical protein
MILDGTIDLNDPSVPTPAHGFVDTLIQGLEQARRPAIVFV